jgi:hypothetical protein
MIDGCERVEHSNTTDDRQGVDYWAYIRSGRALGIDAKARESGASRYWTFGEPDLALERWSVVPDTARPDGVPGWTIDPAKVTDLVLFTFDPADTDLCYLVGLPQLRLAFLRFGKQWRNRYRYAAQTTSSNGRSGYRSACLFVPATVVLDGMREVAIGTTHETSHGTPTDEPPPPAPHDTDSDVGFGLPTDQQARDYTRTGTFTPDPAGWTS